jgi:hypothetical protein
MIPVEIQALIISYLGKDDHILLITGSNILLSLGPSINIISRINLSYISFGNRHIITNKSLKQLIYYTGDLDLSWNKDITDNGLQYVSKAKILSLFSTKITDDGIKHLSNVTKLDIRHCRNLTLKCLEYIHPSAEVLRDKLYSKIQIKYPSDGTIKTSSNKKTRTKYHKLLMKVIHFKHEHDQESMDVEKESVNCQKCKNRAYKWKLGKEVFEYINREPAETIYMFCLNCGKIGSSIYI